MDNEELFNGLKEIINTRDIKEVLDFIFTISRAEGMVPSNKKEDEYVIKDVKKYLGMIEDYFDNKDKPFELPPFIYYYFKF